MNFDKFGDSNNFLIWIVVIAIVVGFGNCKDVLGVNFNKINGCNDVKQRPGHNRNPYPYKKGNDINSFFGGNGLFILLVIVLLFLCKEKKEDMKDRECEVVEEFGDIE